MRRSWIIGALILAFVVAAVLGAKWLNKPGLTEQPASAAQQEATVSILYGGEKTGFLQDPEFIKILHNKYHLTLNAEKRGSVEMVTTDDVSKQDGLWPSNQVAVELAKASGKKVLSAENIFNSPIAFYAWAPVADALVKAGIVELRDKTFYVVKSRALIQLVIDHKPWRDLGVNAYGPVKVYSTDPTKSNSGNMWSGLLASLLNNGDVVTEQTLPNVLPAVNAYFGSLGYMEHSSEDIFQSFLTQGAGARPIIVGYESQLPEFILQNPNIADTIKNNIRIMYPEPTVYASHPLICLTAVCKRLQVALKDPEIQQLAWSGHGFRTGVSGMQNDPALLKLAGIPRTINQIIPMPDAEVMESIINSLKKNDRDQVTDLYTWAPMSDIGALSVHN